MPVASATGTPATSTPASGSPEVSLAPTRSSSSPATAVVATAPPRPTTAIPTRRDPADNSIPLALDTMTRDLPWHGSPESARRTWNQSSFGVSSRFVHRPVGAGPRGAPTARLTAAGIGREPATVGTHLLRVSAELGVDDRT